MTGESDARPGAADRVSTAVATADQPKAPTLVQLIARQENQVERALPSHLKASAGAFTSALITVVRQTPAIQRCDPQSVLGGLIVASQLGLEFGPLGHCYLVPYGSKAQLIIGYKGMIDLAWRSGRLKSIEAREVRANDDFTFAYGLDSKLEHTPSLGADRGAIIAYYGVAHFKDGGHYFLVMSMSDIEARRKRSKAKDDGPWKTDFDAMAKKTVIRAMSAFLPLTSEVLREMEYDGTVTTGTSVDDLESEQYDWIDVDAETGELTQ